MILIAQHLFQVKLPAVGWEIFFESITALGFMVSVFSAWWGVSNERRQTEKTQNIKRTERLFARIEKIESNITKQEEFDKRLEYSLDKITDSVEVNKSQIGRLNAQVNQFENEAALKRRIAKLEMKLLEINSSV